MIVQDVPAEVRIDPTTLYEAAVADRRAGRHEAALEKLDRVLQARPGDVDARLNRGLALLALDRPAEAEADFRAVLDAAPDYVDARIGLARAAQRRGDLAQARVEAGRALAAAPDRPDVRALRQTLGGKVHPFFIPFTPVSVKLSQNGKNDEPFCRSARC